MSSNEFIICKICGDVLNEPIKLPCDKYICKAHENEYADRKMKCILCNQIHPIPEKGWQIEVMVQNLVNQLKTMHLNVSQDKSYKELREKINTFENELEVYKIKAENSAQMIEEYFSNLISQVDLRSEILKQEIDIISEHLKNKLNEEKDKCIKQSKVSRTNKMDIIKEKEKIEKSKKVMNSFEITEYQNSVKELNDSIIKLRRAQSTLERSLLNGRDI